jgi:hypothetical protein
MKDNVNNYNVKSISRKTMFQRENDKMGHIYINKHKLFHESEGQTAGWILSSRRVPPPWLRYGRSLRLTFSLSLSLSL